MCVRRLPAYVCVLMFVCVLMCLGKRILHLRVDVWPLNNVCFVFVRSCLQESKTFFLQFHFKAGARMFCFVVPLCGLLMVVMWSPVLFIAVFKKNLISRLAVPLQLQTERNRTRGRSLGSSLLQTH